MSRHEDIKVEVLEGATPPTIKDLDGLQGVYLWRMSGTPRKTETRTVACTVGKQLIGTAK